MSTSVAEKRIRGLSKHTETNDSDISIFSHVTKLSATSDRHCSQPEWTNSYTLTNKCCCQKQMKFTRKMNNVVFLLLLVFLTNCRLGYSAVVRSSPGLGDIIDLDHEYLKYQSYHNNSDVIDTIQYYFRLDKGDNFVPLRRSEGIDLRSPLCYLDSVSDKVICESTTQQKSHFYHNDEHTVAVAISNENGTMKMTGIVNKDNHTHVLQPLESPGLPTNRYHVIKKRWTANMVRKKANPYQPYPSGKQGRFPQRKQKPNYKKIPDWEKDTGYCIDVLCVVDYSIYKKFKATEKTDSLAMDKIRYYYAHVINGINMRYSTIAQKDLSITVRLAGYFIAKKSTDLPFIDEKKMSSPGYRVNSNYTLTELDSFLKRKQRSKLLPDFNHAMLFLEYASTNSGGSVLDCDDGHIDESTYQYAFQHGEPKDGVSGDDGGTSFVSGICSDSKSTSLVVDHGAYTSAGIGTHELGHNLGVYWHDGEGTARGTTCNASLNYIMAAASYLIDKRNLKYSFTFSKCSTTQIRSNLKNLVQANRNCLQCSVRDRNSRADILIDKEVNGHMEILPGQIDDVHVQCKQLYGDKSFMCPEDPVEMCYRMYCYDPKRGACAIISEQMAATGTPCGKYKVCKMGKCVQDKEKGKDVPDDCPYPDIPSYGAHCEDATPFTCKSEKFRRKCCNSCSKRFTAEEACKDTHILINQMTCSQLMNSMYGAPGCASDESVKNFCCRSCANLRQSGSNNAGVRIHIGIGVGSQNPSFGGQFANSFRSLAGRARSNSITNRISSTMMKSPPSQSNRASPYKVPYNPVRQKPQPTQKNTLSSRPSSCIDKPNVTFNNKSCDVIGATLPEYCRHCQVQTTCCKSCWPHRDGKNSC